MGDHKSRLPRPAGEPDGARGRPERCGRVVQPAKPRADLPECVAGAQPVRPRRGLAQGLARDERQALTALVVEAAGSRGAVEADAFQVPQHRVHRRRPRLRGPADLATDAHGSETAPAGQPLFGHLLFLPRSGTCGDRITGSAQLAPFAQLEASCRGRRDGAGRSGQGLIGALRAWVLTDLANLQGPALGADRRRASPQRVGQGAQDRTARPRGARRIVRRP